MKKKAVTLLLVAAMTATMVAGCGNKAASNEVAADSTASDEAAATEETTGTEAAAEDTADSDEEAWSGTLTVWSPQEDQDTGWLAKECDAFNLDSRINMTRLVPQLRVLHKSQPA